LIGTSQAVAIAPGVPCLPAVEDVVLAAGVMGVPPRNRKGVVAGEEIRDLRRLKRNSTLKWRITSEVAVEALLPQGPRLPTAVRPLRLRTRTWI